MRNRWPTMLLMAGCLGMTARPPEHGLMELHTIRDRYVRSLLPTAREDVERLHARAAAAAPGLREDGTWPDIRYDEDGAASWTKVEHLSRTLLMAKSARLKRMMHAPDAALDARTFAALRFWTGRDFQNPNWWWNQIGVPTLVGEIACLMVDVAPKEHLDAATRIMGRARLETATGANLVWGAIVQIVRGCLEEESPTVARAYERLYREIRIVAPGEEGIQADLSFHQHGRQFYSGGYGLAFANDVARFLSFAHGTTLQAAPAQVEILSRYLLDGQQWMIRGDVFDYSAMGREITRKGKVAVPGDWTDGPIAPTGAAYGLGNAIALLAEMPSPRRGEFIAFRDRLRGDGTGINGNRHFWCSDYMAHQRPGFFASVRMFSTRTLNTEKVNNEGKQSAHLADGANLLYQRGDEYKDLFPVWDWNKVPGTTAEVRQDTNSIETPAVGTFGKSAFVGGVSDGMSGLCAMDLQRGALSAKKAWFFFDDACICLGAGIRCDTDHPVVTSLNQAHLRGPVVTDADKSLPRGEHDLGGRKWVLHDGAAYLLHPGSRFRLRSDLRHGSWSEIGAGSAEPLTLPVFDLWIDHGRRPAGATYAYTVLPGATRETIAQRSTPARPLRNDVQVQAVRSDPAGLLGLVFYEAVAEETPLGRIVPDRPCLLLIRGNQQALEVWASNPLNEAADLRIEIDGRHWIAALPGGAAAGSSIRCTLVESAPGG